MGTFGVKRASDDYFCPSTVVGGIRKPNGGDSAALITVRTRIEEKCARTPES